LKGVGGFDNRRCRWTRCFYKRMDASQDHLWNVQGTAVCGAISRHRLMTLVVWQTPGPHIPSNNTHYHTTVLAAVPQSTSQHRKRQSNPLPYESLMRSQAIYLLNPFLAACDSGRDSACRGSLLQLYPNILVLPRRARSFICLLVRIRAYPRCINLPESGVSDAA
jgi:hypothetical protein